jgi:hypothetical protein
MPTWAAILLSSITIIVILGGAINFPYIPMFFGVYGGEKNTFRAKLILKLIWIFPFAALMFIYLSLTANSLLSLAPFAYIAIVWSIRLNKDSNKGPTKKYVSQQENLQAILDEIEYYWESWPHNNSDNNHILFGFLSSSKESSTHLKNNITKTEKLYCEIEESTYKNNTSTVYSSIRVESLSKAAIIDTCRRLIDIAWESNCELLSVDILENED